MNRREVLNCALGLWASRILEAQQASGRLTENLEVVDAHGANIVAFSTGDGNVLVDSGANISGQNVAAVPHVKTLFNTHYHLDQTGNNEMYAAAGKLVPRRPSPLRFFEPPAL